MVHVSVGEKDFFKILRVKAQFPDRFQKKVEGLHHGRVNEGEAFGGFEQKASNPTVSNVIDVWSYPEWFNSYLPGQISCLIHNVFWCNFYRRVHFIHVCMIHIHEFSFKILN